MLIDFLFCHECLFSCVAFLKILPKKAPNIWAKNASKRHPKVVVKRPQNGENYWGKRFPDIVLTQQSDQFRRRPRKNNISVTAKILLQEKMIFRVLFRIFMDALIYEACNI